ncbi:hypothetical protein B0H65DRAFT_422453 [Neurospora tetraspora]|uniref:Uncharacterized protein n=1 Tax=Neurospora tetraspora TaxID=94610 RepID=A0AAE0MSC6_9PEZI|nr:hypothetical protein B0H65DRAFT_422453 [Neurospora tetraspora]
MDSTIAVTQRLDRLSIAANAPSRPAEILNEASAPHGPSLSIVNQPVVSSETSTQAPASHTFQRQTATAGITTQDSDDDVIMSDEIITATRNLSLQNRPLHLQNRRALEAHGRQHAEWSRLCNRNRHGTVSIAMINIRARQASQARPRPRPFRQAREEAPRFFRQCAQIENRQTRRAHHHRPQTQTPVNTRVQSNCETGITREEHHRNLVRAQLRYRQQIRLVSAIAARAEH